MPNSGRAQDQLVRLHAELLQLETHIRTVRDSVQSVVAQSSETSQYPPLTSNESALVSRITDSVVSRLATQPEAQRHHKKYVREKDAADYLGVKVATLRAWRMRRSKDGPLFARLGRMIMYPVAALEKHMEERLVPPRR